MVLLEYLRCGAIIIATQFQAVFIPGRDTPCPSSHRPRCPPPAPVATGLLSVGMRLLHKDHSISWPVTQRDASRARACVAVLARGLAHRPRHVPLHVCLGASSEALRWLPLPGCREHCARVSRGRVFVSLAQILRPESLSPFGDPAPMADVAASGVRGVRATHPRAHHLHPLFGFRRRPPLGYEGAHRRGFRGPCPAGRGCWAPRHVLLRPSCILFGERPARSLCPPSVRASLFRWPPCVLHMFQTPAP